MIDTVEKHKAVERCRSTARKDRIGGQEDAILSLTRPRRYR